MPDKLIQTRFLPGDRVRAGDISGFISAVSVVWPIVIKYEFTYWDAGKKFEIWCYDFELSEL